MSTQRILFRTIQQLERLQTGQRAITLPGDKRVGATVCMDYIIQAKQDKIIHKIEALVPTKKNLNGKEAFTGRFMISKDLFNSCSKAIRKVNKKEYLINIINDWDTITDIDKLEEYFLTSKGGLPLGKKLSE